MFGFGKSKTVDTPGTKIPVTSREAALEKRCEKLQARYDDLQARYALLYEHNQRQASLIDELRGANDIFQAVG